mgnify:CR=1 FL=1
MGNEERLNHGNPYTVYQGTAAADLIRDSKLLYVICPELMPHSTQGDLAPGKETATLTTKNRSGTAVHTNITTANHLEATWAGESFLRYPPMIKEGEPVDVWLNMDDEKVYWRTSPFGQSSRTTDRLCFAVSASPTNTDPSKTDEQTYSAEINTIDQTIEIRTSQANGEASAFRFKADLKNGQWSSTDDVSDSNTGTANRVFMDTGATSGHPCYQVNLKTGVCLQMLDKDLHVTVPGKFFINVEDRTIFNTPFFLFNPDGGGTVIANVASLTVNVAKDAIASIGGVFGVSASSSKFSGVVIASAFRGLDFLYGAVGKIYTGATIGNPTLGDPQIPNNDSDTDISGTDDKTTISSESVINCMNTIASAFSEVKGKIGVPGDMSSLVQTATSGILNHLKGK